MHITPFRGARVRRPSAAELGEAYVVRSTLEALGARLAVPLMTPADLESLADRFADMQRAAAAGDGQVLAAADADFHGRLLALAGNSTLDRVWRSLEPYSRTYITLVVPGAHPEWTADLHRPILEALRTRDVDAVVAALQHHFDEAAAMLARQWVEEAPAATPVARPQAKLRRPRRATTQKRPFTPGSGRSA